MEDPGGSGARTITGDLPGTLAGPGQAMVCLTTDSGRGYAGAWNNAGVAWCRTGGDDQRTPPEYTLGDLNADDSAERLFREDTVWDIPPRQGGQNVPVPTYDQKNPVHAALLSLVFPGLGQIYNGENFKGFLLFFWVLAGLIILIPGIIIWGYGIYDARAIALKMNSGVIPHRKTDRSMITLYFAMLATIGLLYVLAAFLL